ncbi:unnamed protein product, partial [Amoebophrya sp. A120]
GAGTSREVTTEGEDPDGLAGSGLTNSSNVDVSAQQHQNQQVDTAAGADAPPTTGAATEDEEEDLVVRDDPLNVDQPSSSTRTTRNLMTTTDTTSSGGDVGGDADGEEDTGAAGENDTISMSLSRIPKRVPPSTRKEVTINTSSSGNSGPTPKSHQQGHQSPLRGQAGVGLDITHLCTADLCLRSSTMPVDFLEGLLKDVTHLQRLPGPGAQLPIKHPDEVQEGGASKRRSKGRSSHQLTTGSTSAENAGGAPGVARDADAGTPTGKNGAGVTDSHNSAAQQTSGGAEERSAARPGVESSSSKVAGAPDEEQNDANKTSGNAALTAFEGANQFVRGVNSPFLSHATTSSGGTSAANRAGTGTGTSSDLTGSGGLSSLEQFGRMGSFTSKAPPQPQVTLNLAERHLITQQMAMNFRKIKKQIASTVLNVEKKLRQGDRELGIFFASTRIAQRQLQRSGCVSASSSRKSSRTKLGTTSEQPAASSSQKLLDKIGSSIESGERTAAGEDTSRGRMMLDDHKATSAAETLTRQASNRSGADRSATTSGAAHEDSDVGSPDELNDGLTYDEYLKTELGRNTEYNRFRNYQQVVTTTSTTTTSTTTMITSPLEVVPATEQVDAVHAEEKEAPEMESSIQDAAMFQLLSTLRQTTGYSMKSFIELPHLIKKVFDLTKHLFSAAQAYLNQIQDVESRLSSARIIEQRLLHHIDLLQRRIRVLTN